MRSPQLQTTSKAPSDDARRLRRGNGRRIGLALLVAEAALCTPALARAEVTIAKLPSGWEFYTSGRVGLFAEVLQGQGIPATYADVNGTPTLVHPIYAGGIPVDADPGDSPDPTVSKGRGPLLLSRLRSGFVGNVLTFGARGPLAQDLLLTGQITLWGTVESDRNSRTALDHGNRSAADIREGYIKIESPAGSLIAGRSTTLFSRGAKEINLLYGHGYGVGNPSDSRGPNPGLSDTSGPAGGHIGFGVLSPVYAAGVTYVTPKAGGLQLSVGYFDPAILFAQYWVRAKWGRPEAELTFDADFGPQARLHLFANGAYQKLYNPSDTDSATVYGGGGGARLEVGPVHLGVAGHYGQGVGTSYFMASDDTLVDAAFSGAYIGSKQLRQFDGVYVQSQFILGSFDLNLGWGITRVHQLGADIDPMYFDTATMQPSKSVLKSQMGVSAVLVYHMTNYLHGALDYFRAESRWWEGESQVVNSFNAGVTVTW